MKKLIGLILLLLACGNPPKDSITASAISVGTFTYQDVEESGDSTDGWTNTPAEQGSDTGYYEMEIDLPPTPVPGRPDEVYLARNFKIVRVNRALKEVIRPVPVDTRSICKDVCPNCGGEMRLDNIPCPDKPLVSYGVSSSCAVLHWAWICQSCKKEWYYDGDRP